jgi:hypothetical protein
MDLVSEEPTGRRVRGSDVVEELKASGELDALFDKIEMNRRTGLRGWPHAVALAAGMVRPGEPGRAMASPPRVGAWWSAEPRPGHDYQGRG